MKKFMKKLAKKAEGFTLVELIVVIAILGILAGIAVPAYSGYLTKAAEAGDITSLDAVKTATQAYCAKYGAPTEIVVDTTNTGKINSVKISGVDLDGDGTADNDEEIFNVDEFELFMTGTSGTAIDITLKSDTYKGGAKWPASDTDNSWAKN